MTDSNIKPSHEELIGMLPTQGWQLVTGNKAFPVKDRTLVELVKTTHARYTRGEAPGLISRIENTFEMDLVQIQQLWAYLGLPI